MAVDMKAMQTLWEYQQADSALDRFENKLKKSDTRRKLLKVRNFLLEQQEKIKKLEQNLIGGLENCKLVEKEYQKVEKEAAKIEASFEAADKDDLTSVRKHLKALDDVNKLLTNLRRELQKINKLADGTDSAVQEMRQNIAKGKQDFDALKAKHDEELKEATPELEKLKAEVEKREPDLDAALLKRYKRIKKSRVNPIAKVVNDQCSGCNMSLPSLTMRHLKEGEEVVECESCGRILYYTGE